MDPIIVRRHGERWAVQDSPETAPTAEYDTRALAETAARQAAEGSGRDVVVHDSDDGRLGRVDDPDVEDHQAEPGMRPRSGVDPRHEQMGF